MAGDVTRRAALIAATGVVGSAGIVSGRDAMAAPPRRTALSAAAADVVGTNTVALSFLTSGNPNTRLPQDTEVPIFGNDVYAPGHPQFNAAMTVRPFYGSMYTNWEVELLIAPVTVQNVGSTPGTLLVNIYSDNVYVYQQVITVAAGFYMPVYFGAQMLGYISSLPGSAPMPIAVTMQASGADMVAILDTQGPANFRPEISYPRVAGFGVHLFPMDAGP
jgi:hypothetical protein